MLDYSKLFAHVGVSSITSISRGVLKENGETLEGVKDRSGKVGGIGVRRSLLKDSDL